MALSVITSTPDTPTNMVDMMRDSAMAPMTPMATPIAASLTPSTTTSDITLLRSAPSAMRTPSSKVRSDTA